ncbi:hypothetical protein M885DRAFT_509200 [Pelagophyceae sp. CCMP2097]|nr:hypothetical protein M885DRAFT_509200 [Pelagophyceae sp. CCMP2097]
MRRSALNCGAVAASLALALSHADGFDARDLVGGAALDGDTLPTFGLDGTIEIFVVSADLPVFGSLLSPVISLETYALAFRAEETLTWQSAKTRQGFVMRYSPRHNATAFLPFPAENGWPISQGGVFIDDHVAEYWTRAVFLGRVTSDAFDRLTQDVVVYEERHPNYNAAHWIDAGTGAVMRAASDADAFTQWALDNLAKLGSHLTPIILPFRKSLQFELAQADDLSDQNWEDGSWKRAAACVAVQAVRRSHDQTKNLSKKGWALQDLLQPPMIDCFENVSRLALDDTLYAVALRAPHYAKYVEVPRAVPQPHEAREKAASQGDAVDWLLTFALAMVFVVGFYEFLKKSGALAQCAPRDDAETPRTPDVRRPRTAHATSPSNDLYERLRRDEPKDDGAGAALTAAELRTRRANASQPEPHTAAV